MIDWDIKQKIFCQEEKETVMEKKVLTLIVPAYNEEAALEAFYKETSRVEREMAELCEFEYLFIDDGSKDSTLAIIKKLHA